MDKIELDVSSRKVLGKKVNALRRQSITPANLYGHGVQSTALQVDTRLLQRTIARSGKTSLVFLKVDGSEPRTVLVQNVQKEPTTGGLLHVDFREVKMTEKVRMAVPVHLVGEAPAMRDKRAILMHGLTRLEVECLPMDLPRAIEVDLSSLTEIGQGVHVKDISVGKGIAILTDPEQTVIQIIATKMPAEEIAAVKVEEEVPAAEEAETKGEKPAEVSGGHPHLPSPVKGKKLKGDS